MYCLKGFQDVSLTEDTSKFQSTKKCEGFWETVRFTLICKVPSPTWHTFLLSLFEFWFFFLTFKHAYFLSKEYEKLPLELSQQQNDI